MRTLELSKFLVKRLLSFQSLEIQTNWKFSKFLFSDCHSLSYQPQALPTWRTSLTWMNRDIRLENFSSMPRQTWPVLSHAQDQEVRTTHRRALHGDTQGKMEMGGRGKFLLVPIHTYVSLPKTWEHVTSSLYLGEKDEDKYVVIIIERQWDYQQLEALIPWKLKENKKKGRVDGERLLWVLILEEVIIDQFQPSPYFRWIWCW